MSGRRAFQGLQKIFLGIILCFGIWSSAQQQYPVRITPVMTPPYSLLLPEIAQSSQDKIQLHILMTDLNEPSHQVSLRFKLLAGTSSSVIAQSTPFVNGLPTQNLLPGQPIILSNLDVRPLFQLQNLAGINPQQYAKPLPQGLYQFCFQVIDQHTRRELSNFSCIPVYLQQYEPPFLTLPKNAEIIQKQNEFQNILFQWMPRQIAPNTQYTFTLKEINDNIRDPHSAFLTARTLWQENTLAPNLFYGIDKTPLITGKRYAWQVKATSANPALPNFSINPNDDTGIYQNNGLSEIFFFDYTEHCALPKFLMAKNQGRGKTQILWSFNQYQPNKQYLVQYRKKDSHKDWAEIKTYAENAFINNLEDLTTYEYRVGASCNQTTDGRVQFAFSDIQTFTTDSKQTQNQNYQCGVMPNIDLANQQLFQGSLGANDTFTAGDFPVTILEAEGQNGIFSGKGYIQVPYLADTKIIVAFDNISINTDRRLINGVLETEYDPNEKNVMGVTTAIGELFGDAGAKNMTLNYTIKDIKVVDGKIIIYGNAGEGNTDDNGTDELSQQELELGRDYAITDASGKIFNIDENGNITDAGTLAKGGGSNPQNTDGVDKNGKVSQYTAEGVSIEWKEKTDSSYDRNTQYAFDTEQTSKLGNKGKYPKIKTQKGKLIYAPFKAVVNGKTDRLEAIVHISDDKKLENSEIVFKTVKGKSIKADLEHQSDHQRKYTLTLQGTFNYAEEEVIATIVPKDSLQKQQVISSFTLVHLEPKKIKLSLVPLDEKAKGRLDDIKKNIIDTYKTVGVEFDIQEKEVLDISSIVSGNTIDTEDKDFASTYSKQQNAINALYPDKEERYVLFVTSKNSSKNLKGYFRLNGQFGYIFANADEKTPAHEVGHGVFKLEHPWTQYKTIEGKTNLLMDYSKGQILSHLDWKQINDPKLKLYAFQKQTQGSYETDGHYSTVYLVCLMLGMEPDLAKKLAIAAEAPDTTIHSETKFEINDTWADRMHQLNTHSLTNGFHGADELITALLFLYTDINDIETLGRLLHRYGDTYSHTEISNTPNWEQVEFVNISGHVSPWIEQINNIAKKDGLSFLSDIEKQKQHFNGLTFEEYLNQQFLNKSAHPSDGFRMYGDNHFHGIILPDYTVEHAFSKDGATPDYIWVRPQWYSFYVKNLAYIISSKFGLNYESFNKQYNVFERMIDFVAKHKISMKGIIDYEIAKKLGKKEFYIPVFYSTPVRLFASFDAVFNTNYLQVAKDAVENTKKYMIKQGISEKNITVEEVNNWFRPKINKNEVFVTEAFKITIK